MCVIPHLSATHVYNKSILRKRIKYFIPVSLPIKKAEPPEEALLFNKTYKK